MIPLINPDKKRLITSALPYVNNIPHLGNIIGCVLSADVFARFCKLRGYKAIHIGGTDDHGTATEVKAIEEGKTPKEICDYYRKIHKKIYDWFEIDFDKFGQTSTEKHSEIVSSIFLDLWNNGFVYEKEVSQPYDPKTGMYLADRFIEGTCPFCGYDSARADQCDKCGKLLTYEELVNPKSKLSGETPQIRQTKHLFLKLSALQKDVQKWLESAESKGFWTRNATSIASSWLKEGLKDRDISRNLKWGVPIPIENYGNLVFYVWFEACIGYISITALYTNLWKEWWQGDTRIYHFIGKDNVPFHAIIFPATLIGTKRPWVLPYHINATEYLNYEGGKFSKSRNRGVFGTDAMESGIPSDVWRYYLLRNRPEQSDSNFDWDDFAEKNNHELISNIGNLVNRVLVFIKKNFDGRIPNRGELSESDKEFLVSQKKRAEQITTSLEFCRLKQALSEILEFSSSANKYFQENAPWKSIKENKERAGTVIFVLANQVKDLSILLSPYLPSSSRKIAEMIKSGERGWSDIGNLSLTEGLEIEEPESLFRRIEKKEIDEFKKRFSGQKSEESKPISFNKLDIVVGRIEKVVKHPNADRLFVEIINIGDRKIQVVSGVADKYSESELLGRNVLVLKNLKPARIRGVLSQGMILVAESGGDYEVLSSEDWFVSDRPVLEGEQIETSEKPEIGIDEFKNANFSISDGVVTYGGKRVLVGSKEIRTKFRKGRVR